MRILALDISTKAGYAVLDVSDSGERKLVEYGSVKLGAVILSFGDYPWCYLHAAQEQALKLVKLEEKFLPDIIVVEEVNLGKSVWAQKSLDYTHCMFLHLLDGDTKAKIVYLSSRAWRQALGQVMSKDQKKANAKLSKAKREAADSGAKLDKVALGIRGKVTKKHLAVKYVNDTYNLSLKMVENDSADAICLATAYMQNAVPCTGY
jgi:hypothetical protein